MYKIIKGFKGSPDGHSVIDYKPGDEVELSDSLAEVALAEKWAKKMAQKKLETDVQAASLEAPAAPPAVLPEPTSEE